MFYLLIFLINNIYCFQKNNSIYNNNKEQKILAIESKRRLKSAFEPIRIKIDTTCLDEQMKTNSYETILPNIKNALSRTKLTLEKLIKVERLQEPINWSSVASDNNIKLFNNITGRRITDDHFSADLVIYIRKLEGQGDMASLGGANFSSPNLIAKPSIYYSINGRPVVATVVYNDLYINIPTENQQNIEFLSYLFMHEFTHILGFTKSVLVEKGIIEKKSIKNRFNDMSSLKFAVVNERVLNFSKFYFNCPNISSLELDDKASEKDFEDIHWESRLLLGDYMTREIYYSEQVISEFTLVLLDSFDFYEINNYSGGLMNFGKNKGCSFINGDCIKIESQVQILSLFPNEFCSSYEKSLAFGSCSAGRQSMGYCYNSITSNSLGANIRNAEVLRGLGQDFIEYCPITYDVDKSPINGVRNEFYNGNCKIGKGKYGVDLSNISQTYEGYSDIFDEEYGDHSFCALSSILKQNESNTNVSGIIRPTCYPMYCSNKSLTIQIKNEYIVCPPRGGLVKIDEKYSKYKGFLFCPDYNLICSKTEICNNMFDCVEKNSTYKDTSYDFRDYTKINSTIGLEYNKEDWTKEGIEGYEKSEDGICPLNCRQCNSYKQCINCRTNYNYVGNKENDNDSVNCSYDALGDGYYKTNNYRDSKTYYFRCIDNCKKCDINKDICDECFPTHFVDNNICKERIPGCKDYNYSYKYHDNDGIEALKYCLNCDNNEGFFCVDGNKEVCVNLSDYNNETYYNMESKSFPCVQKCDKNYKNCLKCNDTTCTECKSSNSFVNKNNNCVEKIEHCINQNDTNDNKECLKCDESIGYFCVSGDTINCKQINDKIYYYTYKTDRNIECIERCNNTIPHCLQCTKDECTLCENGYFINNGECIKNITGCIDHYYNGTIKECNECNMKDGYYCFNNSKTECHLLDINTKIPFFYLTTKDEYPCYISCDNLLANCYKCDESKCIECTSEYIVNDAGSYCIVRPFDIPDDDTCNLKLYETNLKIHEIDPWNFTDYYWKNIPYVSTVDFYIGENFTVTVFTNSSCTEDLFNKGYFKLDTTELEQTMIKESHTEGMKILFSVYINYNHKSHLRYYNLTTWYLDPYKLCQSCLNVDYTLTKRFDAPLNDTLGEAILNFAISENLDVMDRKSDFYNDICKNVTPYGIDIPLKKRLYYLYLDKYLEPLLCDSDNCIIDQYFYENLTVVCKCRMGNKLEDIINSEKFEYKHFEEEVKSSNDFVDSLKIIKCTANGFALKNFKSNIGIFICIGFIAIQISLFIFYFIRSKPIANVNKPIIMSNPPKKTILKIITDWDKTVINKKLEDEEEIYVQPRDDADDQLLEEERSYANDGNIIDISGLSIDTNVGGAIKNISTGNKLREKADQKKVLILLSNKGKNKSKNLEEDLRSDSDIIPLPQDENNTGINIDYGRIYWHVLSLKQHIINFFSCINCCKITESYVPASIRLIRSLFMIILSFILNIIWLNQTYFDDKFEFFNKEYKIINSETAEIIIPLGNKITYSVGKTFVKAALSFLILLVVQFLFGIIFFSVRKGLIKAKNKKSHKAIQEFASKMKVKNIIFFSLVLALMIVFFFTLAGFIGAYGGGVVDYLTAGIISLILLEIFPFIWSIIIALFRYYGIKNNIKCLFKISQFFMF